MWPVATRSSRHDYVIFVLRSCNILLYPTEKEANAESLTARGRRWINKFLWCFRRKQRCATSDNFERFSKEEEEIVGLSSWLEFRIGRRIQEVFEFHYVTKIANAAKTIIYNHNLYSIRTGNIRNCSRTVPSHCQYARSQLKGSIYIVNMISLIFIGISTISLRLTEGSQKKHVVLTFFLSVLLSLVTHYHWPKHYFSLDSFSSFPEL